MIIKSNSIFLAVIMGFFVLLFACDSPQPQKKQTSSSVISKKITQPISKGASGEIEEDKKTQIQPKNKKGKLPTNNPALSPLDKKTIQDEHYSSKGKIDPFKPLIQEKPKRTTPIVDKKPKRILTPLEKVELSQIRLVAVIIMKNRELAMVEDATGKGYEVGLGTYIGKKQGRVFKIKDSSILVKELAKDFKGRIVENIQEIKLHKNDSEE